MKLAPLLAGSTDEELARLASEHVRSDEHFSRSQQCNFLESAILSFRFVQDFLMNRQPPTFAFLTLLLDVPNFELPMEGLKALVTAETRRIAELVATGEILARDEQLRLYRRVLYEARRNDSDVNSSESAILARLRQESDVAHVEHFLIEHHPDLKEFWDKEDSFEHEENALRSAGLVFFRDHKVLIPEDLVPAISQSLGIEMPTDSLRRLLAFLTSSDLANALQWSGSQVSGNKEERLQRVITERIQPRVILKQVDGETLKNICRETGAAIKGRKDEVIERIIEHFSSRLDQVPEEPPLPPRVEARVLSKGNFETMFGFLQHQELSDILRRFLDLRQAGTKETRIETLWEAHLSEQTFLSELMNRDLENILYRLGLRLAGSKNDRIGRIIGHFSVQQEPTPPITPETSNLPVGPADYAQVQETFRQKASSPTASLQPWLNELLNANGLVRCYATEDATPSKQLKNKLSQAASATSGLLILLLNDEDALNRTREALVERWMSNDEWPKSVACVALACPLGSASIRYVISNRLNDWPSRLRKQLFPGLEDVSAIGALMTQPTCSQCGQLLDFTGRFCPNCGRARE